LAPAELRSPADRATNTFDTTKPIDTTKPRPGPTRLVGINMAPQPWENLSNERLVHYKVFDVRKARRRSPRNGREVGFFLVDTLDWVDVVALTPTEEVVMVRQFRHGPQRVTLEIPGGVLATPDEDPMQAAIRELREETGFSAQHVRRIGAVNPNPSIFTNTCTTFLATGCTKVADLDQDEGEDIEVVLVPLAEIEDRIRSGEIDHSLVVSALYFHRLHR
jgi:8-oxo-dGTP pyrophosphatase MutT (NUDIX family)